MFSLIVPGFLCIKWCLWLLNVKGLKVLLVLLRGILWGHSLIHADPVVLSRTRRFVLSLRLIHI